MTKELDERENHYLLEARGGDIFAWRYRDASYYCQIHSVRLNVNGTIINNVFTNPLVKITFARAFSKNWFHPAFKPVYGTNEEDDDVLTHFMPPRARKFSGETIPPNQDLDLWSPTDQSDPDNKKSNWYWRLELDPSRKFLRNRLPFDWQVLQFSSVSASRSNSDTNTRSISIDVLRFHFYIFHATISYDYTSCVRVLQCFPQQCQVRTCKASNYMIKRTIFETAYFRLIYKRKYSVRIVHGHGLGLATERGADRQCIRNTKNRLRQNSSFRETC